jgi:ligand-binding sensor domain-containing protein/two-component sensor histidine kinase
MHKSILYLLTFFCFSQQGTTQQQMGAYMAYGPEAKFFSNLNYSVFQSANGYLWFGTSSGLVRFDGKRYKNYFSDYKNPNSPSDNSIFDIAEDKNHDLWFAGYEHGVTKYNQHSGRFTKYTSLSKDKNPFYGIRRIINDSEGNLWIGSFGRGLAKYDFVKDSFDFYYQDPDKPTDGTDANYNNVTDIVEDPNHKNILWIGTHQGLYSFNKTDKKFTHYFWELAKFETFPNMPVNDIEADQKGLLWLGTFGDYLQCFDTRTKKFVDRRKQRFAKIVYDLKMINDSILYAACLNDGLYQLNIRTGAFSNITPPRNTADSAAKLPNIQRISVTKDAGVFIGGNHYVYQQHPDYLRLKKTIPYPDEDNQKSPFALNSLIWDKKRELYWIATDYNSGLYTLNKNLQQMNPLSFEHVSAQTNRYFYDLSIDALNRVWVLQYYYGIFVWNEQKKIFSKPEKQIPLPETVISNISEIQTDPQGNFWMVSGENFIFWNILENKTETYPIRWAAAYQGQHHIGNSDLKTDPEGNAWLFTVNGMFHCNRAEKKVVHIFKTGNTVSDLSSSIVLTGAFDSYNGLWITSGNGIQKLNRKNYSVMENFDIHNGLPTMKIISIHADNQGRIWAGTASGLCMFDPENKNWILFNRFDGMNLDYMDVYMGITSNNKMVLDQQNSILLRDIDELVPAAHPPILHITSVLINNKVYVDSVLPEFIKELVLPYNQNNIDIEFAAMDWIYPFKTYYYYSIEGGTSENDLTVNQDCKINLVNLQPGKYVLHIKALNGKGVFSKEIVFPITIKPPFWKTAWFIAGCILLFSGIVYALYRYRINRIIEMQNVRNSISRDLHDEIGATLSSVNMLSAVAISKAGKENDALPILKQIKDSVQQAGESMDDIVWSVNPVHDLASDTFARIRKYITELAEAKGVTCTIAIEDPAPQLKLSMDIRRDICMVCKEAVNNALKYSGCTAIKLEIRVLPQGLLLNLQDNGTGFDPALQDNNIRNGINNIRHRVEKHKGVFELKTGIHNGTFYNCTFPLK